MEVDLVDKYLNGNEDEIESIEVLINKIKALEDEIEVLKDNSHIYGDFLSLIQYLMVTYDTNADILTIFIMEKNKKIIVYNGALEDWKTKKVENKDIDIKDFSLFESLCNSFKEGQKEFEYEIKIRLFAKDNETEWCLLKGKTIIDLTGEKKVVATITKINPSDKKHNINFMMENSRDPGTDLINKRVITKYAMELINSKPNYPVTFIVIDLDNFKCINDTYGHMFGDTVLSNVAEILKEAVFLENGVVGRIGGDEMLIIVENLKTENDIRKILKDIRMNVECAYKNKFNSLSLTCSIGCATYPKDAKEYDSLFKIADKCLYLAKGKGKNRYIIYERDIHGELIEESGEFVCSDNKCRRFNKINLVHDITENLLYKKNITIEKAFEKVAFAFELDDISVYRGENRERECYYGDLLKGSNGEFFDKEEYLNYFDECHMLIVNNLNYLESKSDSAIEYFVENKITASIQHMVVGPSGNPLGFITFNKCKLSKKWTETDAGYLSIIGKIFEIVLF